MAYRFTADDDVDFALQTLLGGVAYGAGDVGEILTTFAALTPGDQPGWATAFSELGQRIEEIAGSARRAGARASAGAAYLRALPEGTSYCLPAVGGGDTCSECASTFVTIEHDGDAAVIATLQQIIQQALR